MPTKLTKILSYGERVNFHVMMLRRLLKNHHKTFYRYCPYFEIHGSECGICLKFIGIENFPDCPCTILGPEEAIKRTKEKLNNYIPYKRKSLI